MTIERCVELLKIEKECILRQDTPECCRESLSCAKCDLVQDADEISDMYDTSINIINSYKNLENLAVTMAEIIEKRDKEDSNERT